MKKLVLLLSFALVLAGPAPARATDDPAVIIVRLNDSPNNVRLVVERGSGKAEVLEFEGGYTEKSNRISAKGYHDFIAKLYQAGYVLQATIPGPSAANASLSTLVFVKTAKL
jgi:hypothetical protein